MSLDEHKITRIESFTFRREFPDIWDTMLRLVPREKLDLKRFAALIPIKEQAVSDVPLLLTNPFTASLVVP